VRLSSPRQGFSVVELLVVIFVIAVLIGLLVPGIFAVRQAMNRTHCANNLHQVGMAYHGFLDAHRGRPSAFKGDSEWMNQLKPFLDKRGEIFVCVSAPNAANDNTEKTHFVTFIADSAYELVDVEAKWAVNERAVLALDLFEGQDIIRAVSFRRLWQDDPAASYGINAKASKLDLNQDSQKVLTLDYSKAVIYPGVGEINSDMWPTEAALRHGGMLNVLFIDGSVRGMTHRDINPNIDLIYDEYWRPRFLQ